MSSDYFEQDITPPLRKRLTQMVIAALLITTVASLIAIKVLSDQRQQAIEEAERAVNAQETAEAQANTRQPVETLREPAMNITSTVAVVVAQSRSREMAYAALTQLDTDPERSILLAIEANRAARTPEAEDVLRRSLSAMDTHLRHTLSLGSAAIRAAQFSPDGAHVLTHARWSAQVWNLDGGRMQYTLQGHTGDIVDANYSHDGKHILTLGTDKTVRVWSADTGVLLFGLQTGGGNPLIGRFSPDDQRFAVAAQDGTVQVISATGGNLMNDFHVPDVASLAWSPDGQSLLTSGLDQAVRVWDSRDGSLRFEEHEAHLIATFSPDSRYVAAVGPADVQVWSIAGGQTICTIHEVTATGLQFGPRGDQLLISEWYTGRVMLWDLWPPTKCALSMTGPSGYRASRFSPDGVSVAFQEVEDARTITLWSFEKYGRGLQPMVTLHAGADVIAMQFSADSRSFLTINLDGAVQVWSVASDTLPDSVDRLIVLAQAQVTRQLTCAERRDYLHETGPCDLP